MLLFGKGTTADFYSHLEFNSKLSSADAIAQALDACNPDAEEANSKADNSKPTSNEENA